MFYFLYSISYIIPEGSVPCSDFRHHKFYIQLALPISPEIMDRFLCSRCLNDHIKVLTLIGSFASGANVSLVTKNGTKKNIPLLSIKSSKKPQIKKFHKTDPPKVGNLIQNTISKFSKIKNLTQKRPPKVPKIKNIYKEASNQKVL